MRKELETIALIERYLGGKMTPEEQLHFEAEMAVNEELQEDVERQRALVGALLVAAFASDVKNFHTELVAQPSKMLGKMVWYSLSGIALVIGLTATGMWWRNEMTSHNNAPKKNGSAQHIYTSNVNHAPKDSIPSDEIVPVKRKRSAKPAFDPDAHRSQVNLQNFLPQSHMVKMNPNEDFTFKMAESNSTVHIPANSIVHSNGKPVNGEVEIRYKEYRDAADIAFSKLPMTVHQDNEEFAFNSAGMFEIYAFQNGEKLALTPEKPMTVDYNVTDELPDLYFWQLQNGQWKKLRAIQFPPLKPKKDSSSNFGNAPQQKAAPRARLVLNRTYGRKSLKSFRVETKQGKSINNWAYRRDLIDDFEFNCAAGVTYVCYAAGMTPLYIDSIPCGYDSVTTLNVYMQPVKKTTFWARTSEKLASKSRKARMNQKGFASVISKMPQYGGKIVWDNESQELMNNTFSKLSDTAAQKANEQYRKLVTGLQCPDFGVYNCDQTYRIANRITVDGNYIDDNGTELSESGLLSVITSGVNGAISYSPDQFACSADGTTLLLFSSSNQIYVLDRSKFQEMNLKENGDYTFQMHNATEEIKNSDDLRRYLNLPSR